MTDIYLASDLAHKRTEIIERARHGLAQIRDKDSMSLVMLPERRLRMLEEIAKWSLAHMRLQELLRREAAPPTVTDLGDLAWLRVFDLEDLQEFVDELHSALVAAHSDEDPSVLNECIHAWRVTARQLEDPLRRSILLGRHSSEEFSEAEPPR